MNIDFYVQFEVGSTSGSTTGKITPISVSATPPSGYANKLGCVTVKFSVDMPQELFLPLEATPMKVDLPAGKKQTANAKAAVVQLARDLEAGT